MFLLAPARSICSANTQTLTATMSKIPRPRQSYTGHSNLQRKAHSVSSGNDSVRCDSTTRPTTPRQIFTCNSIDDYRNCCAHSIASEEFVSADEVSIDDEITTSDGGLEPSSDDAGAKEPQPITANAITAPTNSSAIPPTMRCMPSRTKSEYLIRNRLQSKNALLRIRAEIIDLYLRKESMDVAKH